MDMIVAKIISGAEVTLEFDENVSGFGGSDTFTATLFFPGQGCNGGGDGSGNGYGDDGIGGFSNGGGDGDGESWAAGQGEGYGDGDGDGLGAGQADGAYVDSHNGYIYRRDAIRWI